MNHLITFGGGTAFHAVFFSVTIVMLLKISKIIVTMVNGVAHYFLNGMITLIKCVTT